MRLRAKFAWLNHSRCETEIELLVRRVEYHLASAVVLFDI